MSRSRYELTEREWPIIAPLLPCKPRGVPRVDNHMVLNGILWRFRTAHHGPKSRSVTVLQRPATTGFFAGVVPVSGIGC
jgi:hypothetical protein